MSKRSSIFRHQVLVDCCDDYARLLFIHSLVNDFNQTFSQFSCLQDGPEAGESEFLEDPPPGSSQKSRETVSQGSRG